MNFELSLHMISDWGVGTGTGVHGYVDRLIQRDTSTRTPGPPIIPAKTLVGVWRDSCEVAAYALDSGPVGVWHEWLEFLFGGQYGPGDTPVRPAALVVEGALRPPPKLTALLREKPLLAWAATFRKPGVAIDPETGGAMTDMLRFEEMGRGGVTLKGQARIEGFDELDARRQEVAVALLSAGARLLETIGGKRRRGSGRCRLTIAAFPQEWTLPEGEIPSSPRALPYVVADRPPSVTRAARPGWERVELVVTVEEPVLVAATVRGNLAEGAGHLPGWCLMPEVLRRLGGVAHSLARTGDLVVTAATPQSPTGMRTLPIPRVLVHRKGEPHRVAGSLLLGETYGMEQCKSGYITPDGAEVVTPAFTLRMHNTISDDVQRPLRKVGGVYIYRALAAGTVLRGEVRVRAGLLEPGWEKALAGRWRVGRSSKDDYGKINVEVYPAVAPPEREAEDVLRVWLLSDLLVRNPRLRPSTHLADVARALEQALAKAGAAGVTLRPVDGQTFAGTARTESWHRAWGLPRPTLYGLAAGSCLTFEVDGGPISAAALAEVRAAGIGERRAEGFGQVEFDHELLYGVIGEHDRRPQASAEVPELLTPGEEGYETARVFEYAAWRTEIHRACERIMGNPELRSLITPSGVATSQLNALREITADLSTAGSRLQWLLRDKKGRSPWPEEAKKTVTELFTTPDRVWELLALPEEDLVATGDGAETLRRDLRHEAIKVLVHACLAAHARDEASKGSEA